MHYEQIVATHEGCTYLTACKICSSNHDLTVSTKLVMKKMILFGKRKSKEKKNAFWIEMIG